MAFMKSVGMHCPDEKAGSGLLFSDLLVLRVNKTLMKDDDLTVWDVLQCI